MLRLPLAIVAALGLAAGACATKTDVVATGETREAGSDGRFLTDFHLCVPGRYEGTFNYLKDPDAQVQYPVSGFINFRLVRARSGEFANIDPGAKLSGKSDNGDLISADIDTNVDGGRSGCYEGVFKVDLVNGQFFRGDAAASGATFTGSVEGTYRAEPPEFTGTWKAFFGGVLQISQGDWQALWHGE